MLLKILGSILNLFFAAFSLTNFKSALIILRADDETFIKRVRSWCLILDVSPSSASSSSLNSNSLIACCNRSSSLLSVINILSNLVNTSCSSICLSLLPYPTCFKYRDIVAIAVSIIPIYLSFIWGTKSA